MEWAARLFVVRTDKQRARRARSVSIPAACWRSHAVAGFSSVNPRVGTTVVVLVWFEVTILEGAFSETFSSYSFFLLICGFQSACRSYFGSCSRAGKKTRTRSSWQFANKSQTPRTQQHPFVRRQCPRKPLGLNNRIKMGATYTQRSTK